MKELLEALAKFGEDPDKIGDNLFSFFAAIMSMNWTDCVAAGMAINALKLNVFYKENSTRDPVYLRLRSCLEPVLARTLELLSEAPQERRHALLLSVSGRDGYVNHDKQKEWKKVLGIAEE